MKNLKELKESIIVSEWAEELTTYDEGEINTAIWEIAGDASAFHVDITEIDDRAQWMEYVVEEELIDLNNYSYSAHEEEAVNAYVENYIREELEDALKLCACCILENQFPELIKGGCINEDIEGIIDSVDTSINSFEEISDLFQEYIDNLEEAEENEI